ncbi:MAG: agmatinase [Gaiellaceae bacterium]
MPEPPYRPLDAQVIPRFAGVRTFMRLPHVTDLAGVDAAAVGIPFDTATSYRAGARFGPEAIRSASVLLRPFHPDFGLDLLEALSVVDYGDLPVAPGDTEGTYRRVEEALGRVVEADVFPLVMGGDHSITLAELRVLARAHGPLALVQLDAHADTWEAYFGQRYFHGTTFKRAVEEGLVEAAASVQAGMRGSLYASTDLDVSRELGFRVISSDELRALGPQGFAREVFDRVGERLVFLSFDVDFLDPAYAPGTGTPEIAGFTTHEAVALLRSLRGVRLGGCDVVEVSPPYDGAGQPTALAAASILWELLALKAATV